MIAFAPPEAPMLELHLKVGYLDITPRVRNALERAGIETIGDLIERSARDLSILRGIGARSISQIRRVLWFAGLHLRDDPAPGEGQTKPPAVS